MGAIQTSRNRPFPETPMELVVLPERHGLARRDAVSVTDLGAEPLILPRRDTPAGRFRSVIEQLCAQAARQWSTTSSTAWQTPRPHTRSNGEPGQSSQTPTLTFPSHSAGAVARAPGPQPTSSARIPGSTPAKSISSDASSAP